MMMKACFMKTALLMVLAGVTLSAGAKPGEIKLEDRAWVASGQESYLTIAATFAGKLIGPKRQAQISPDKP